jgi:hypothetical protein
MPPPDAPFGPLRSTPDKPIWDMVDVRFEREFPRFVTLAELRAAAATAAGGRLSGAPEADAATASPPAQQQGEGRADDGGPEGPCAPLQGMLLFSRFRLSVMPVSQRHWDAIVAMAEQPPPAPSSGPSPPPQKKKEPKHEEQAGNGEGTASPKAPLSPRVRRSRPRRQEQGAGGAGEADGSTGLEPAVLSTLVASAGAATRSRARKAPRKR